MCNSDCIPEAWPVQDYDRRSRSIENGQCFFVGRDHRAVLCSLAWSIQEYWSIVKWEAGIVLGNVNVGDLGGYSTSNQVNDSRESVGGSWILSYHVEG